MALPQPLPRAGGEYNFTAGVCLFRRYFRGRPVGHALLAVGLGDLRILDYHHLFRRSPEKHRIFIVIDIRRDSGKKLLIYPAVTFARFDKIRIPFADQNTVFNSTFDAAFYFLENTFTTLIAVF